MGDFGFGFGSGGFDPFGIDGWLTGEIAAILSALSYIWGALVTAANWLYDAVVRLAKFLASHVWLTAKALAHVVDDLYEKILKPLIEEVRKIEEFLRDRLLALEDLLGRIYAWYVKYILKWQLLAIEIISRVRVAIELFKLLGFQWAQKLDAELQKIQGYITQSIIDVVRTLNTITTWLNFATDPLGLLRKQFWQTTAFTGFADIYKATHLGSLAPTSAADTATAKGNLALMNPATPPVTIGAAGAPVLAPQMQDISDGLKNSLIYYNPTVPGYVGPQ
jgi:hypothetical protein